MGNLVRGPGLTTPILCTRSLLHGIVGFAATRLTRVGRRQLRRPRRRLTRPRLPLERLYHHGEFKSCRWGRVAQGIAKCATPVPLTADRGNSYYYSARHQSSLVPPPSVRSYHPSMNAAARVARHSVQSLSYSSRLSYSHSTATTSKEPVSGV